MESTVLSAETYWLHEVMRVTGGDFFFRTDVEKKIDAVGWIRPDLTAFLRANNVSQSEKCDFGWRWLVEGHDCDDRMVRVVLEVETSEHRIEVIDVELI